MGDTMIGILGLGVLIGAIWLWRQFTSSLGKKANQAVFHRKGHREGQDLVAQTLFFNANASPEKLRSAFDSHVQVAQSKPAVIGDAYVLEATDDHIIYECGNRVRRSFSGLLEFSPDGDNTKGSWRVLNWTLVDGIVDGQSVMKRLNADIRSAVISVDPRASFRTVDEGIR
jgi:hypothetical protein